MVELLPSLRFGKLFSTRADGKKVYLSTNTPTPTWKILSGQPTLCCSFGVDCVHCGGDNEWPPDILKMIREKVRLSLQPGLKRRTWSERHAFIELHTFRLKPSNVRHLEDGNYDFCYPNISTWYCELCGELKVEEIGWPTGSWDDDSSSAAIAEMALVTYRCNPCGTKKLHWVP